MALDLNKKLSTRRGKIPARFPYDVLTLFAALPNTKKMNLEIVDHVGMKKVKGQFIVLSNHTSRCDWQYVGLAMYPHKLNFMASDIEFHRAHMHFVFDLMHVIPKKNFVPDLHSIREVTQVVKAGGNLMFFPEGKSSISGTNQPIMMGTSQLLKKMNIPVYTARITGGYLSNTQWNIADRPGKVIITVDRLFTPGEMADLPLEEMDRRINAALYNDDFEWNRTARVHYKGTEHIAEKLEEHLYFCPKCGKEHTVKGEGRRFVCAECGNGMEIDDMYDLHPLDDTCVIPKNLRVWFELQRRRVFRQIRDSEDFLLEEKVTLGALPTDHYVDKHVTSEPVGEGVIRLTREEFSFVGTKNGQPFELHQKTKAMPTVILETDSSYFGAYFDGTYYEFTPSRPVTTKWLLSVEECHRRAGGKWQNILPAQQWIYEDDREDDRERYFL